MRQELPLREANESFLVRSDLMDVDVVEPGLCVLVDLGEVLAGIRADDDALGDLLRGDELDRLLEVGRRRQLLPQLARERAAAYCGKIARSAKRMNPSWSGPTWWMYT